MKMIIISAIILMLAACTNKDFNVVGRWQTKPQKDAVLTAVFKDDNTFEGYINEKMFTRGTYSFKDRVITFKNDKMTACSDTKGSYKLTFFADTAMRFDVISDNCSGRKEGTNGMVCVRAKE